MSHAVDIAARKVLETYALMHDDAKAESFRQSLVEFLEQKFAAGEHDDGRLAVAGLIFLREKDGSRAAASEGDDEED